jgi:hypothetical protein
MSTSGSGNFGPFLVFATFVYCSMIGSLESATARSYVVGKRAYVRVDRMTGGKDPSVSVVLGGANRVTQLELGWYCFE